jgi:chromosome segregation ATPase
MAALNIDASPSKDTVAFALLIGMILLAAVMFGVGVSGIANSTVHKWLRSAGFGTNTEMRAELGQRKTEIADLRVSLDRMIGESATLDSHTQDIANRDAAQSERIAELNQEMALLKARFRALLPVDPLESLANGGTDLLTLRTTLDDQAEHNRHEFDALNKRIDHLENLLAPVEATGALHPAEKRRRTGAHGPFGQVAPRGN